MQGMFSRTFLLTLANGREVVQQFRTEPLDLEAFEIAKKALGPVVPDAVALEDEDLSSEGVWAYSFLVSMARCRYTELPARAQRVELLLINLLVVSCPKATLTTAAARP